MPVKPEIIKMRNEAKRAETPPSDQLCENGCGSPAQFHLMRSIKTETGVILRWYWCCAKHYKKCPAKKAASEEAKRSTTKDRYGVEHHMQAPSFVKKKEQTCLERYGVINPISLPEFVEKKQQTEIARHGSLRSGFDHRRELLRKLFGVENVFQLPGMGQRIQQTIRAKYGQHYSKNQEWRDRYKEETGYEHSRQNPAYEAKRAATCVARYGVVGPYENEEVRARGRRTNLEKFGVAHPMQSPKFYYTQLKAGYTRKPFTFPSGRTIQVQGYEPQVIQELLDSGVPESNILTGIDCPSFFYNFEGKLHRYYPDILIKSQNLIIEVKSVYTYQKTLVMNQAKAMAVVEAGYNFEFRIKHPQRLFETTILHPYMQEPR